MTHPDTLTNWVLAAGIEAELIQAEAETGHNVAFAKRPLNSRERQAGVRFGDLDAITTANTEEGTPVIDALYAGALAAVMVELYGSASGEDTDAVEVAAAIALLWLLLSRPPAAYTAEATLAAGKLGAIIQDSYVGGVLTVLDEAQHQGKAIVRWPTPQVPATIPDLARDITAHPLQRTVESINHTLQTPRKALEGTVTRGEITTLIQGTAPGVTPAGKALSQKGTVDLLNQANQAALGAGRNDTVELAPDDPEFIIASEVLDGNTCGPCGRIDGTEYPSIAAAKADYPTGYIHCEGGSRCRGVLVFGWNTDS